MNAPSHDCAEMEAADVVVVGAGPIGLELAAALKADGIDYLHFEAGQIGHTMSWWPPGTEFFSSANAVAIAGMPVPIQDPDHPRVTREMYLAYLRSVVETLDLRVRTYEKVVRAERDDDGFLLTTEKRTGCDTYRCRRLVLATGGLARPRMLGIPGENLPHVSHYPDDPHRYFRTRLLVVGGMNSALETALRAFHTGAQVTLSYRGPTIERGLAKRFLEAEVMELARQRRIALRLDSVPVEITPSHVVLAAARNGVPGEGPRTKELADFVLLCTGYEADVSLFEMLGAELAGDQRAPLYHEDTMETTVPALYVAGTAIGGTQTRFEHFIETSHVHVGRIVAALEKPPDCDPGVLAGP